MANRCATAPHRACCCWEMHTPRSTAFSIPLPNSATCAIHGPAAATGGNLVEINGPVGEYTTADIPELRAITELFPQGPETAGARLYL